MYQSFRHKDGNRGEAPLNEKGELIEAIGYNKNKACFVKVTLVHGEPVLRISGETYGCVFTIQVFQIIT